ncbi:MAG: (d)CMP kinase [Lachnospiraceae bacterium]|nr:(d)CMP kinase [Lachnospiraceae bacterium]MDD7548045.1 (d)CMP kinase [Lachnospiraceae bacterium]
MNIAIDGPAGAGKSTIAKKVAKKMGYIYVDTGAMYRAMALFMIKQGIDPSDAPSIEEACKIADISIEYRDGEQVVLLNGENVNAYLRTEEVGNMASVTSVNAKVREKLVELQQKLAKTKDVVMDGRDIGTVVLPNAEVKVYLTASSLVRAQRRALELEAKGESADLSKIEADIIERDNRDMTRAISPLKQAEDATLIDSSYMTIDEVVEAILNLVK